MQRSSRKLFTAHYACRNADLNLTLVTGTTNGFTFQNLGGYALSALKYIKHRRKKPHAHHEAHLHTMKVYTT